MARKFTFDEPQILYYGHADLLAQIGHELASRPDSCFSKNVLAWYNATYVAESLDFSDCSYQVEQQAPSTLEDVIDVISSFVQGKNRRLARAAIRIICRESQRLLTENTAQDV